MPIKKRIILYSKIRTFHKTIYSYSLFREKEKLYISIEELKNGKPSVQSTIENPEYSEKICLAFVAALAESITFPEQLQEIYEENDLHTFS